MRRSLLLAPALLLLAACTLRVANAPGGPPAALDAGEQRRIDAYAVRFMREQSVPGLALGIVRDGQIVLARGFGVASVDTREAVTPGTVFQLGSVSKVMLGIALMQLKEAGRVDLDAPVTNYLPYFRTADPRYRQITLRMLLSHSSGLPYCSERGECHNADYRAPQYDDGALERHARDLGHLGLEREPGRRMSYSDLGFEILGDVIAKVSGQSFEDYMRDHVFVPLGMSHSSFLLADVPPQRLAAPHVGDATLPVSDFYPYSRQHAPSSHLFSTTEDMSRFALAQLGRGCLGEARILPPNAYDGMWAPQVPTAIESVWERQLGLGWFVGARAGHRLVGHEGQDTGYASELLLAPEDGVAVVVMANRQVSLEVFAFQIMCWLLDSPVQGRK